MSSAASTPASPAVARSGFLRARLASFLAIFPLARVDVLPPLAQPRRRSRGRTPGRRRSPSTRTRSPQALTGVVVLLPLAIHTVWGIGRLATSAARTTSATGFYANLKYLLQRLAGARRAAAFSARTSGSRCSSRASSRGTPRRSPTSPSRCTFTRRRWSSYVLGTLGVAYHLANGLQTFCMGWGVVSQPRGAEEAGGRGARRLRAAPRHGAGGPSTPSGRRARLHPI